MKNTPFFCGSPFCFVDVIIVLNFSCLSLLFFRDSLAEKPADLVAFAASYFGRFVPSASQGLTHSIPQPFEENGHEFFQSKEELADAEAEKDIKEMQNE